MAYIPFYNKYRPQKFDEVVGQAEIVKTLQNAIKEDKIAHAYLFCGPRGTGKTTMARLFAKALNCNEGLGHQCNLCDNCISITKGDHPDVIEIDAASNSSVESVRDLIDNVGYQPIQSKFKIYIIDEVHNMSNAAFNALLKTLEEPPKFVVFILATTEPQKILPTILSRVQRFDFNRINNEELINNMIHILNKENVQYDLEALKIIAEISDGGVRDSLSLLDQVVSYSISKVTLDDVNALFGLLSINDELKIIDYIEKKQTEELFALLDKKVKAGVDIIRLHQDLIKIYRDLLLFKSTNNEQFLEKIDKSNAVKYDIPTKKISYYIEELIKARREYKFADNIYMNFQLTLLKLLDEINITPVEVENKVVHKLVTQPSQIQIKEEKKEEKTQSNTPITYTTDDILAIMSKGIKEENAQKRKELSSLWENIKNAKEDEYFINLLYGCKLRVCADNILLVTNDLNNKIDEINSIENQPKLRKITKEIFSTEYNILCLTSSAFMNYYSNFETKKKGQEKISEDIKIEFNKLSKRDEFLNDILGD